MACGPFLLTLMHSQTNAHILHLQTNSYAEHKALGAYYESVDDLIDTFAEAYQGKYGIERDYPQEYYLPEGSPLQYMIGLLEYVTDNRADLPQDSELQNIIDEIVSLIDSTIYKLRFLK